MQFSRRSGTSRLRCYDWYNSSRTMGKKKRISNREWFEQHREQFERTDRLLRERLAYGEAIRKAERAARGERNEPEQPS